MLIKKFNQLIQEINQDGFLYFVRKKTTEQFYNYKFRKLKVRYPDGQGMIEIVNSESVNKDSKRNQATAYYALKEGFDFTKLNYSEISLLDIGCGYGKAINLGMLLNFKEVTGIDIDHSAVEKAIDNCTRMNKQGYTTPFSVTHADASKYRIPGGINLVFMFNPFGKKTMELVAENIIRNTYNASREIYVVYCKPVHQDVFLNYKECIKIYERFNRKGTNSEMVIFKIYHNQLQNPD